MIRCHASRSPQPSTSLSAISRTSPSSTLSSVRRPAPCRGAGAASPAPRAGAQARQATGVASVEDAGSEPYSRGPNSGLLSGVGVDRKILARKPEQHRDRRPTERRDTAGEFQPSSLSPWDQTDDFHLWRNIVWQFSEQFLAVWLDHWCQTPASERRSRRAGAQRTRRCAALRPSARVPSRLRP